MPFRLTAAEGPLPTWPLSITYFSSDGEKKKTFLSDVYSDKIRIINVRLI